MESSKRCNHGDLLRELPDVLIFDIFWRLPMTDVVRTSVLSKGWRNFWTTAPFLNFDNRAMLFDDNSKLQNFVNQALSCWNGNRVLKFRFHSHNEIASSMFSDVDWWVNFAQRNGVKELDLHVLCITKRAWPGFDGKEVYRVPPCLYSYSSLKELSLQSCNLEINGNVQWNKLECLKINAFRAAPDVIGQILSSTPQLKVFYLTYVDKGGILSIQSNSLKELSIDKYIMGPDDFFVLSDLRICTPNLESLEIKGLPYKKYFLTDVSSLTRAVLGSVPFGLGHFLQVWLSKALSQILQSIQHVENVALSVCCPKVVGGLKMNFRHSAFPNVKSLELRCCLDDCKQAVGVLAMFPQLETLVIRGKKEDGLQDDTEPLKFEANIPESFLLRLRTIEVTWSDQGYDIFPLIEILLKYASKLEKIVFQLYTIKSPAPSNSLSLVSQKLKGMQRSSTNCTINLTQLSL
ncbi:putative F-box protein At1g49610 [Salvia hispanica]|uniref:putative F-box protein At1g49610 n=1 Tax=Salvia hispanica TaxID=49212 RepID=UPI0020098E3B|nr:putative F-box protein At1g49610 [Salvia hispanica]